MAKNNKWVTIDQLLHSMEETGKAKKSIQVGEHKKKLTFLEGRDKDNSGKLLFVVELCSFKVAMAMAMYDSVSFFYYQGVLNY